MAVIQFLVCFWVLSSDDGCGTGQGCCVEKRLLVGSKVHSSEASCWMARDWSTR